MSDARGRTRLTRRTLLDELTAGLVALIEEEGYQIGDRLPSMSALAAHFGVATPTLREAARRLEAAGTITFRHGSGIFVTGDSRRLVIANPARTELGDQTTLDVLDTRLLIEPELARRAAQRATHEQLAAIGVLLDEARHSIEAADERTLTPLNMRFHVAIARAAGNQVLTEALQSVVELYEPQQSVIGRIYADPWRDHNEHRDIYDALVRKDAAKAHDLMRRHLEGVLAVVSATLRHETD